MMKEQQFVLDDFENAQELDLKRLPAQARITVEGSVPNAFTIHFVNDTGGG